MNGLRVLIDTCVILDFLMDREPFSSEANTILSLCEHGKLEGFIAAHSVPNLFYILRRDMSLSQIKMAVTNLCDILTVEAIDERKIRKTLSDSYFTDYEDCLQYECALYADVDYIITRNVKDFAASSIKAITPREFLDSGTCASSLPAN